MFISPDSQNTSHTTHSQPKLVFGVKTLGKVASGMNIGTTSGSTPNAAMRISTGTAAHSLTGLRRAATLKRPTTFDTSLGARNSAFVKQSTMKPTTDHNAVIDLETFPEADRVDLGRPLTQSTRVSSKIAEATQQEKSILRRSKTDYDLEDTSFQGVDYDHPHKLVEQDYKFLRNQHLKSTRDNLIKRYE